MEFTKSKSITFQHVLDYPDKPWSWYDLSRNKNITFQNVLDHPDKPWDYNSIWKFNHLFKVDEDEIIQFAKRFLKINKIKRQWFCSITNPEYLLCRKRLLKEFDFLN